MKTHLTPEDREFIGRALPHISQEGSDAQIARQFDWESCDMASVSPQTDVEHSSYHFGKTAEEWAAEDWENLDSYRREELRAAGITDADRYAAQLVAEGRLVQGEFGVFETA